MFILDFCGRWEESISSNLEYSENALVMLLLSALQPNNYVGDQNIYGIIDLERLLPTAFLVQMWICRVRLLLWMVLNYNSFFHVDEVLFGRTI